MTFREAIEKDLPNLITLLLDDRLGRKREDLNAYDYYAAAFAAISQDPNQMILIAEEEDLLLGCVQVSYLANLTFQGMWRAQLEGVRVRSDRRGEGLGKQLVEEAIRRAKERGCGMVQLTTNKKRPEAARFYNKLGFAETHVGMKLMLETEK